MNPNNAQNFQDSISKMMWDNTDAAFGNSPMGLFMKANFWAAEHPNASSIIGSIYLVIWLFSIWTCLRQTEGIDRLTWLVLILAVPIFGIIFFWILFNRPEREYSDLNLYRTTPPPTPTPTKAERSIAEAVNASIEESLRKKNKK